MKKKQVVTTQSMRKIEDGEHLPWSLSLLIYKTNSLAVSYAIKVRSSEFGSDPAALKEMLRRSLTSDNRREGEGLDEEER